MHFPEVGWWWRKPASAPLQKIVQQGASGETHALHHNPLRSPQRWDMDIALPTLTLSPLSPLPDQELDFFPLKLLQFKPIIFREMSAIIVCERRAFVCVHACVRGWLGCSNKSPSQPPPAPPQPDSLGSRPAPLAGSAQAGSLRSPLFRGLPSRSPQRPPRSPRLLAGTRMRRPRGPPPLGSAGPAAPAARRYSPRKKKRQKAFAKIMLINPTVLVFCLSPSGKK